MVVDWTKFKLFWPMTREKKRGMNRSSSIFRVNFFISDDIFNINNEYRLPLGAEHFEKTELTFWTAIFLNPSFQAAAILPQLDKF